MNDNAINIGFMFQENRYNKEKLNYIESRNQFFYYLFGEKLYTSLPIKKINENTFSVDITTSADLLYLDFIDENETSEFTINVKVNDLNKELEKNYDGKNFREGIMEFENIYDDQTLILKFDTNNDINILPVKL